MVRFGSGYLLILPKSMRNSEKPGFSTFVALGQRDTSLEEFDLEVEGWLPLLPEVDLPLVRFLLMLFSVRVPLRVVLMVGVGGS